MAKRIKRNSTPDLSKIVTPELLGQAIKARRTQSNIRIEDAAALCGVAKQTFMQIEHGSPTCQLEKVLLICASLGIKLRIMPWRENNEDENDWI